jgi:hypothetical protein
MKFYVVVVTVMILYGRVVDNIHGTLRGKFVKEVLLQ